VDYPTGRKYTGSKIKDQAVKIASGLTRLGYKKGDVVLIFSSNCPEYPVIFMGCAAAGVTVSPANPVYTPGLTCLHIYSFVIYTSLTFSKYGSL